jgi:D-xylonolactonase
VGGFTRQADGSLLLFRDRGNIAVWRNGAVERTVVDEVPDLRSTRFNDVCADPEGRVFCGTMADLRHTGRLYRLERDGTLVLLFEGLGTPNGMGFAPDLRTFYFNDSHATTRVTWAFEYDRASGALANRRLFRDAKAGDDPGNPDGLAVDAAGAVWTARWDGAALLRHGPDGAVLDRVAFPVRKVSSLCFAGDGLTDIYATTAGGHLRPGDGPYAGALFRVRGAPAAGLARFDSHAGI